MLPNVTKAARRTGDIALIVGPVVGGMLFIAIVGLVVFLFMARKGGRERFSSVVRFSVVDVIIHGTITELYLSLVVKKDNLKTKGFCMLKEIEITDKSTYKQKCVCYPVSTSIR